MTMVASDLVKNDQAHLIHPQHHSSEAAEPLVIVEGHGAVIKDIKGHEYIDGLAGLWNVAWGTAARSWRRPRSSRCRRSPTTRTTRASRTSPPSSWPPRS